KSVFQPCLVSSSSTDRIDEELVFQAQRQIRVDNSVFVSSYPFVIHSLHDKHLSIEHGPVQRPVHAHLAILLREETPEGPGAKGGDDGDKGLAECLAQGSELVWIRAP